MFFMIRFVCFCDSKNKEASNVFFYILESVSRGNPDGEQAVLRLDTVRLVSVSRGLCLAAKLAGAPLPRPNPFFSQL